MPRKRQIDVPSVSVPLPAPTGSEELLDKALDSVTMVSRILEELAGSNAAMGVTELARTLDESKGRIYRFLSSLRAHGLVEQEHETERYRLGWRLFQLGERAGVQFDLRRIAEPVLKQLRDVTGQSCVLSVPLNGEALVVAVADNDQGGVCITVRPGNRPAPNSTAQGRVALAWATPSQVARLLAPDRLKAASAMSMSDPDQVRARLQVIRERLWEDAPNEVLVGINLLAAPVLRENDELVGILGIVGATQDVPSPPLQRHLSLLQGAAAQLSAQLGSRLYERLGIAVSSKP